LRPDFVKAVNQLRDRLAQQGRTIEISTLNTFGLNQDTNGMLRAMNALQADDDKTVRTHAAAGMQALTS
jgi:asparagine synthetase A